MYPTAPHGNYSENQRADEAGALGKLLVDGRCTRNSRSGRGCGDGGHKQLLWGLTTLRFGCGKLYESAVTAR
jgi:hypothetical protein